MIDTMCKFPVKLLLIVGLLISSLIGWSQNNTLFKLLPSSETGVTFKNTITESDSFNILNQANTYNGGSMGIGDFNKNDLMDIYLAGNMVSNKLYLNKENLKFDDYLNHQESLN